MANRKLTGRVLPLAGGDPAARQPFAKTAAERLETAPDDAGSGSRRARARLQAVRLAGGWRARYEEADAERALVTAEAAYETARAQHEEARQADREQRRREFLPKKRALIAKLDAALGAAAALNGQLVELESQERDAVGNHMSEWWSWSELLPGSAIADSRLDMWRRAARDNGLLDWK